MVGQHPQKVPPIQLVLSITGTKVQFEVDTGCSVTILSKKKYAELRDLAVLPKLEKSLIKLKTYTGERLHVKGCVHVTVNHQNVSRVLPLIIVAGPGPNLLGQSWLQELSMEVHPVHKVEHHDPVAPTSTDQLEQLFKKHEVAFKEELGTLKGFQAVIHVDPDAKPKFFKPRSVPYAIRHLVEKELDRLLESKIIEPVTLSDWAAPIVPLLKSCGGVRICGDYKVPVNWVSSVAQYPIPRVEDWFAKLSGGKQFSKLDMSHAYLQVPFDTGSKKYVTINTQ